MSEEIKKKIETEVDFINAKKYNNSLKNLKEVYKRHIPDKVIAIFLGITTEQVQQIYKNIINKLQNKE